jgi:DNA-binding CsgD family transcriptional regulator
VPDRLAGWTGSAALLAAATRNAPARQAPPAFPEVLPDGLTGREAEILAMMARGMTNPGIAAELCLSTHTIKSHINRIFAKTGSADRSAAVRYAVDKHLAWPRLRTTTTGVPFFLVAAPWVCQVQGPKHGHAKVPGRPALGLAA